MYVYCTMPLSGADQTRGVDKPWTNTIRRGQRRVIFYSINLWYVNWKCPVYFLVRINVYFIRFLIIYTSFVFSHQDAWYLISSRCAPKGYPSSLVTSNIIPSLFDGRNFIKWVKWLSWTCKHTRGIHFKILLHTTRTFDMKYTCAYCQVKRPSLKSQNCNVLRR